MNERLAKMLEESQKMADEFTAVYEAARFTLAQIACEPGGWVEPIVAPDPAVLRAAEQRWAARSHRPEACARVDGYPDWIEHQCGGCRWFAAAGADYGICFNEKSPLDGMVTFEHGGCLEHSFLTDPQPPEAS